jgi:hypothetical protein
MKWLIAVASLVVSVSNAEAVEALPSPPRHIAQSLLPVASSSTFLPDVKGRKGSMRVGGYNSKGKGSRYVGGRK